MGIYLSSKLLRNEEYYEKQVNYIEIAKETVILTAAVAVIAAAVLFLFGAKPCVSQQYFRSWNRAF